VLRVTDSKKGVNFWVTLIVGALIGIMGFAMLLRFVPQIAEFPFQINIFFVGLIVGSIPLLINLCNKFEFKMSYLIPLAIAFLLVVGLAIVHQSSAMGEFSALRADEPIVGMAGISDVVVRSLALFGVGLIASITMLIPGVNTMFAIAFQGTYSEILYAMQGLISPDTMEESILILLPVLLGVIVGVAGMAIMLRWLLKKFSSYFYYTILGLMIGSIFATIFVPATFHNWITGQLISFDEIGNLGRALRGTTFDGNPFWGVFLAIVLFVLGASLAYFIGKRRVPVGEALEEAVSEEELVVKEEESETGDKEVRED